MHSRSFVDITRTLITMDQLLFLLLELKRAQLMLSQAQSARNVRIEHRAPRSAAVPSVSPISAVPKPVTSTVTPAPAQATPVTSSDYAIQIEQHVLRETNNARAQNGLAALASDPRVAAVARAHSADMIANNYFDHTNRSGCNAGCRLTNAGYVWKSYGENIHWMSGYRLSAEAAAKKIVTDWMNSPGHRANILGAFTYAGVGIAVRGDTVYSTTDYTTN